MTHSKSCHIKHGTQSQNIPPHVTGVCQPGLVSLYIQGKAPGIATVFWMTPRCPAHPSTLACAFRPWASQSVATRLPIRRFFRCPASCADIPTAHRWRRGHPWQRWRPAHIAALLPFNLPRPFTSCFALLNLCRHAPNKTCTKYVWSRVWRLLHCLHTCACESTHRNA